MLKILIFELYFAYNFTITVVVVRKNRPHSNNIVNCIIIQIFFLYHWALIAFCLSTFCSRSLYFLPRYNAMGFFF